MTETFKIRENLRNTDGMAAMIIRELRIVMEWVYDLETRFLHLDAVGTEARKKS